MDELGLTMVDEGGLLLRQLMRQARQRIVKEGSVIRTSVETFMEFIESSLTYSAYYCVSALALLLNFVLPSLEKSSILRQN